MGTPEAIVSAIDWLKGNTKWPQFGWDERQGHWVAQCQSDDNSFLARGTGKGLFEALTKTIEAAKQVK